MKRVTLHQMQCLVAVADAGRFGEAARKLNISQPGLSIQISNLETQLGVVLIERSLKGAILTKRGRELVKRARRILSDVGELIAFAQSDDGILRGRLQLGVLPSIGAYLLPMATKDLHVRYPDLRFTIREGNTSHLIDDLQDGRFDIVVSTPNNRAGIDGMPLFTESLWICSAPDDPLVSERRPVTLSELRGRALLNLGGGFSLSQTVERLAQLSGAYVSTEYEGSSLDAVRQMAVMGDGVAVLPSLYALGEAMRDSEFVVRRIDHPEARHDIALIWRAGSPAEPTFRRLGEGLIAVYETLPGDLPTP